MKYIFHVAFLFFFIIICTISCTNSSAKDEFITPGTKGFEIETSLKNVVRNCFGSNIYTSEFIPLTIKQSPTKENLLTAGGDANLISGIRFDLLSNSVFDKNTGLSNQITDAGHLFRVGINFPESMPLDNATNLYYLFTCFSALNTAVSQGYSFGFLGGSANIKQAFQSQSDINASNSLLIIYGLIESPLYLSLVSPDPYLKAKASSWLWFYYTRTPNAVSGEITPTVLRSIKGWLITQTSAREASTLLSAEGQANASLLSLKAELSGRIKITPKSTFNSTIFKILLDTPLKFNADFYDIPSPAQLIENIANAAKTYPEGQAVSYLEGVPSKFTAEIKGIPPWLCQSHWHAETNITHTIKTEYSASNESCSITSNITIPNGASDIITVSFINDDYRIDAKKYEKIIIPLTYSIHRSAPLKVYPTSDPSVVFSNEKNVVITIPFDIQPKTPSSFSSVNWTGEPEFLCNSNGMSVQPNIYPSYNLGKTGTDQYTAQITATFTDSSYEKINCQIKIPLDIFDGSAHPIPTRYLGPVSVTLNHPH